MKWTRTLARLLFPGLVAEAQDYRDRYEHQLGRVETRDRELAALRGWRDARRDLDAHDRRAERERDVIQKRMTAHSIAADKGETMTAHKIADTMGVPHEVVDHAQALARVSRSAPDATAIDKAYAAAEDQIVALSDPRDTADAAAIDKAVDTSISSEEIATVRTLTKNGEPEAITSAVIFRLCDAAGAAGAALKALEHPDVRAAPPRLIHDLKRSDGERWAVGDALEKLTGSPEPPAQSLAKDGDELPYIASEKMCENPCHETPADSRPHKHVLTNPGPLHRFGIHWGCAGQLGDETDYEAWVRRNAMVPPPPPPTR